MNKKNKDKKGLKDFSTGLFNLDSGTTKVHYMLIEIVSTLLR